MPQLLVQNIEYDERYVWKTKKNGASPGCAKRDPGLCCETSSRLMPWHGLVD
jgi:hypothetical protein